jgi:O-antigen ligase
MQNKLIVLYLLYCFSSIAWSDEPFILVKRWIKDLGNPIMALVLLTEARPYEAVGITLRRLAFLLLPLSALFVRYFPDMGRSYKNDGSPMFTGVGHQKNDLGLMCLCAGMYLSWKLLQRRTGTRAAAEPIDRYDVILIGMLMWLLRMSDSQTSLSCLVVVTLLLLLARVAPVASKPARLIPIIVTAAVLFMVIEPTFHVKDQILAMLGRDPSLTSRVDLWDVVNKQASNPLLGAGFMSFWAGDRMVAIWAALGPGINQAHNGYLEQYVNLGYVGVFFIVAIMAAALFNIRRHLETDPAAALLRVSFLVAAALYNYTEASFYGINNMWVLLLIASIDVQGLQPADASDGVAAPDSRLLVESISRTPERRSRPAAVLAPSARTASGRLRPSSPDTRGTRIR